MALEMGILVNKPYKNLYGHILQNKDLGIKTAAIYLDLSKALTQYPTTYYWKN